LLQYPSHKSRPLALVYLLKKKCGES
jgi:hypothetical protein